MAPNHRAQRLRVALLASLPTAGAVLGASLDEATRQGFSTWRSACRAGGVSLGSVLQFTWQLLPNAILGVLLAGLLLLGLGLQSRRHAREYAAAHLGCALAMPLAMLACVFSLPVSLMPVVDAAFAAAAALLLLRALRPRAVTLHP